MQSKGRSDGTKSNSLFEGHQQPNVPLNGNYYNLLEKNTLEWQASLMHKYGIYGMCFYHYYFKDGRKILEKPAENLLKWKDINMPFCFSWANETWARSWSKLQDKNVWSNLEEKSNNQGVKDDGILLLQDYGGKKEWIDHILYQLTVKMTQWMLLCTKNRSIFFRHKDHLNMIKIIR